MLSQSNGTNRRRYYHTTITENITDLYLYKVFLYLAHVPCAVFPLEKMVRTISRIQSDHVFVDVFLGIETYGKVTIK